jgi:hypothetical protein
VDLADFNRTIAEHVRVRHVLAHDRAELVGRQGYFGLAVCRAPGT